MAEVELSQASQERSSTTNWSGACSVATARRSTCWCASTSIGSSALIGRYIADWSECQDVAQETFLRAYRALGNFRGDAQFYTWLHRIAVNTAKNHLVSHNRRPPTDDIDVEDAEQFASGMRLRDNDTPERELMRQQLEQTVMRAVEALPEELRVAITLREVDGLSYEEIADEDGLPDRHGAFAHLPRPRGDRPGNAAPHGQCGHAPTERAKR